MFVLFFRIKRNGKTSIKKLVFENRLDVRKFLKKVAGKGKVIVISTTFGLVIFFSGMKPAHGMGGLSKAQPFIFTEKSYPSKVLPRNIKLNVEESEYLENYL